MQTKYLALDFHEERKWKRAFASIYANNAKNEIDEKKKKKKIDDLYKKCYSIYFTINHGNNSSEFSDDNKNELNDYLKPKLNEYNNLEKELNNWKKQIKDLENKLKSNIKMEGIYVNGFLDIFSLIQSIINNQEEKLKEMKLTNKNNNIQNFTATGSLSDLAVLLQNSNNLIARENKNCTIIADKSNINYNKVKSNLSEIIKQVIDEFNKQVIIVEETNINNSFKQNTANQNNQNNINNNNINNNNNSNAYNNISNNINNQNNIDTNNNSNNSNINNNIKNTDNQEVNKNNYSTLNNNLNSTKSEEEEMNDFETKLNNGLNPSKLILNIQEEISQEDLVKSLQYHLDIDNCFVLPMYNFEKLINTTYDLNNIEFDNKNVFYKIFPMIENDEKKLASKKLVDGLEVPLPLPPIKQSKKIVATDFEQTTRYELLTPLQKLIILYGIFTTGNNPYLINCILNAYYPTHCIMYSIDEMNYICKKILDEVGIEFESNFCNIKEDIFNYDINNRFFLNNSQKVDIESALYMSEYTDFEYNNTIKKIFSLKDDNNKDEYSQIFHNIKKKDQYKLNCDFNINNKNISIQRSKILTNILTKNPYLTNKEIKKKYFSKIVQYLKNICEKIKDFQKNNKSKYNYFSGDVLENNTKQINDMNYKEIIENKNRKMNKNDVLKQLREHKNENYSIKQKREELIKKETIKENDIKTKILSVLNTYYEYNIKHEWESMRKVWYQNNQRFNPIFKIDKLSEGIKKTNPIGNRATEIYESNNTQVNRNTTDGSSIFSNVQKVNTNQ